MKELEKASRIQGMEVNRDKAKGVLALLQESQEKEAKTFKMNEATVVEGKESGTELMDTRFQIITDLVSKGDVVLSKILKTIEPTDVMTQAIDGEDFHACYDLLNIVRRTTQLQAPGNTVRRLIFQVELQILIPCGVSVMKIQEIRVRISAAQRGKRISSKRGDDSWLREYLKSSRRKRTPVHQRSCCENSKLECYVIYENRKRPNEGRSGL
ncbi:unnamed protein product [Arabidopsis thaliana]|uniref:Uncharacterized protein n=1 Tax=Arabidopsis thaliana TaxID=3702 RepID=A0A5S9TXQ3_ARATH|nr:unnamed protein product [Arabidopsis thaliana]